MSSLFVQWNLSFRIQVPVLLLFGCLAWISPCVGYVQAEDSATEQQRGEQPVSESDASEQPAEAGEPIPPPKNSPLVTEPKGTEELMDAIALTLEIARLDAAKVYLQQFLALKPEAAELSRLRRNYGPALYLRLANVKELQPESLQLLKSTNDAFQKEANDPEQIRARILELTGDNDTREAAYVELRSAGMTVVPGILKELATTDNQELQTILVRLLEAIGPVCEPQLVGALETDSQIVLLSTIRTLEVIGNSRTAEHLWYFSAAPSQPEIVHITAQNALRRLVPELVKSSGSTASPAEELRKLTRRYYRGEGDDLPELENEATLWNWDTSAGTIVSQTVGREEASMLLALKFGREALELAPQDEEMQTAYLTGALEHEVKNQEGVFTLTEGKGTAFEAALKAGADKISRVLEIAMVDRRIPAAVAACRILGRIGTPRQLQQKSNKPAALIQALDDSDPRIQYEAAQAVVQIKPQTKFPQSARVVEILSRALVSEVTSKWNALIVEPSLDRGSFLMGMAKASGAEARLASTGMQAFQMATDGAAPDFILMNVGVSRWGLSETLANLRGDARTARIPIVLFGPLTGEEIVENELAKTILDESVEMSQRIKTVEELTNRMRTSGGVMDKQFLRRLSDLADKTQDREMQAALAGLMQRLVTKSFRPSKQMLRPETLSSPIDIREKYRDELTEGKRLFYIEDPQSSEDFRAQVKPFEAKIRNLGMGPQERQRQARLAAVTLAKIGQSKLSTVFPLAPAQASLLEASNNTEVLYDVLSALSVLPTGPVQNRLAEIALKDSVDLGLRTQATEFLTSQVNQAGVLLKAETQKRLLTLVDEVEDEKFQTALLGLVGSLQPDSSRLGRSPEK